MLAAKFTNLEYTNKGFYRVIMNSGDHAPIVSVKDCILGIETCVNSLDRVLLAITKTYDIQRTISDHYLHVEAKLAMVQTRGLYNGSISE